jgi:hypothetical protein
MQRRRDILAPDYLAVGRIERQHLGISGRDVEPVVPERRPAAECVAAQLFGLQIDLPDAAAITGVERADLDAAIHREHPAMGDDRLRQHPGAPPGALADAGIPGARKLVRQGGMDHRMSRVAAGLRPVSIGRGGRQCHRHAGELRVGIELRVEAEHGNALAGQRLLLVAEPVASGRRH